MFCPALIRMVFIARPNAAARPLRIKTSRAVALCVRVCKCTFSSWAVSCSSAVVVRSINLEADTRVGAVVGAVVAAI